MIRNLPIIFGQTDYLQQLGTTGGSIKDWGCKLTTFATLAKACGKVTDPIELNKVFIQKNIYADGKNLTDDAITKVYPDIIFQKAIDYSSSPADINLLREALKDPTVWAVLRVSIPPPFNTHFVLVTGVNGVVTIADPLTKQSEDFAKYGDPAEKITKIAFYKGNPAVAEQIDEKIRIDRDINWNLISELVSYLGIQVSPEDKPGMVEKAKQKIDSYISTVSEYTRQLEELKKKYEDEQKLVISLRGEITALHSQDKDYGQEALDAQHKVTELQEGLAKIGGYMELQYDPADDKKLVEEILGEIAHRDKLIKDSQSPEVQLVKIILKKLDKYLAMNTYLEKLNMDAIDIEQLTDEEIAEKLEYFLAQVQHELLKEPVSIPQEVKADSSIKQSIKKRNVLVRLIKGILGKVLVLE